MNFASAEFRRSVYTPEQLTATSEKEIVFSGKSNVGKSSLINKLFNNKSLARVSSEPGKTASINFYYSEPLYFVDLPGYGYARVSKQTKQQWADLVEGYFSSDRNIVLVVQLMDARHNPSQYDMDMLHFLRQNRCPFIVALTKSDKLKPSELSRRVEEFKGIFSEIGAVPFIVISSRTGEGIDALKKTILAHL